MSYELIAISMFVAMVVLLAVTGREIFAVIGTVAVAFALALWGPDKALEIAFHGSYKVINWYSLVSLPMFVYMGYMFAKSGIADDLYQMFYVWMGPVRGGLAIGTVLLQTIIAAINGLSVAGMSIGSTLCMPEMLKRKYNKVLVTGVIMGSSSLGILVPPSVVLVLYAMIARQPVGKLWMAGFLPGFLMAFLFIVYIAVRCWLRPELGPPAPLEERQIPWAQKLALLRSGIIPVLIIFSMTGLFLLGITTMVEASAVGALLTTLIALLKRRLDWPAMLDVLRETLRVSCMFMWIISAALVFSAVYDALGAVKALERIFLGHLSPMAVLAVMQASFLVMGTFLDDTAMLIVVAPLYLPLLVKMGFDPTWYGILYTITCQVAYLTPPFGYNLFLMKAMAPREITLLDIYRSVVPFVAVMVVTLIILMAFPQIALWLPQVYFQGRAMR